MVVGVGPGRRVPGPGRRGWVCARVSGEVSVGAESRMIPSQSQNVTKSTRIGGSEKLDD